MLVLVLVVAGSVLVLAVLLVPALAGLVLGLAVVLICGGGRRSRTRAARNKTACSLGAEHGGLLTGGSLWLGQLTGPA